MSSAPTAWTADLRDRWDELLQEYRSGLRAQLDDLTEEQARRHLVPSKTTLLGLLKHVTYVEAYWFDHAITGASLKDLGVASTPGRSFTLSKTDTIASVTTAHHARCEASDRNLANLTLDDKVHGDDAGNGGGDGDGGRAVWALYAQVLRELAHHSGHADILREQIVADGLESTGSSST